MTIYYKTVKAKAIKTSDGIGADIIRTSNISTSTLEYINNEFVLLVATNTSQKDIDDFMTANKDKVVIEDVPYEKIKGMYKVSKTQETPYISTVLEEL